MSIAIVIWLIFKTLLMAGLILVLTPIGVAAAIGGTIMFDEARGPSVAAVKFWTWPWVRWISLLLWAKALGLLLLIVLIMNKLAQILFLFP